MRTALALFQLAIGVAAAFAIFMLFASLAAISEPVSGPGVLIRWVPPLVGPISLVVGSVLTLVSGAERAGAWISITGAVGVTVCAIYCVASIGQDQLRRGFDAGPLIFAGLVLLTALASALTAYRVYRLVAGAGDATIR